MGLKNHNINREYRSLEDNIVQEFYIPLLSEAVMYKRAVGYFSSSALVEITKGITKLAAKGGNIELVASPYLSEDDIAAINKGYEDRNAVIERALLSQIKSWEEPADYFSIKRLNLLASLISSGVMDIKIAYTENKGGIGMYHEKMGIIEDTNGDKVAFSGSNNETAAAMSWNYETMDVYRSWGDKSEKDFVNLKENAFFKIWNNDERNIEVQSFPEINKELIKKYKIEEPNYQIDDLQFKKRAAYYSSSSVVKDRKPIGARKPDNIKLYDYQEEAIVNWVSENYRGIFDMATGTGKTLTGLSAIAKLSKDVNDNLAVIILCPYQHLVEQWVEDIVRFNIKPIIGFSTSPQKDWKKRLKKAILDQQIRKEKRFFCFVSTNATFATKFVQEEISKIKAPILLVADEAHNLGANCYKKLLDDRFQYRLALSATLDRHNDEEGTEFLYKFFGKKCIEYTLERAIKEEKLTRYKYYPCVVYLTDKELSDYEQLSYEISKCLIKDKNGKFKLNKRGEALASQRARLIAGASSKLDKLREVIVPYIHQNNILVYCGAANVNEKSDNMDEDESEIKQILAVTKILGNEFDMKVAKFTAEENIGTRQKIIEKFQEDNGLQAIVAIKCLDEGVNIPGIRTAFILASTTNPKEYIQRRGRVLRRAKGKQFSEIYDFVTLPRDLKSVPGLTEEESKKDLTLVNNELARIIEFGRLSMNPMQADELIWNIKEAYHIVDQKSIKTIEENEHGN